MAENSTPTPGTPTAPAESTPAPGTGTQPQGNQPSATPPAAPAAPAPSTPAKPGDPKIPTDPVEAAKYWENRHKEATGELTRVTQKNSRYRDVYGDLDDAPPPAPALAPTSAAPGSEDAPLTKREFQDFQLTSSLAKIPSLSPHKDEIASVMSPKISFAEACKIVADRHNITLGPKPDLLETMPTDAGGGAMPPAQKDFTPQQKEAMQREGKDPEKAKKHLPTLERVWKRALKK